MVQTWKLVSMPISPCIKFVAAFRQLSYHCRYLCQYHSKAPKRINYDDRKRGSHKKLPGSKSITTPFEPLPDLPTDVFRCTDYELIGPGCNTGKCCMYKNPEYFAYHELTYYDIHLVLRPFRKPSAKCGRKP